MSAIEAISVPTHPVLQSLEPELRLVLDKMRSAATVDLEVLEEALAYVIAVGGKLIRPSLALLTSTMGRPVDEKTISLAASLEMLHTACEQMGSLQACSMRARALTLGAGGKGKVKEGVALAERLCQSGELSSCLLAGIAYIQGKGIKRDPKRGARFIVVACAAGFPSACELQKRLPPKVVEELQEEIKTAQTPAAAPPPVAAPPSLLGGAAPMQ